MTALPRHKLRRPPLQGTLLPLILLCLVSLFGEHTRSCSFATSRGQAATTTGQALKAKRAVLLGELATWVSEQGGFVSPHTETVFIEGLGLAVRAAKQLPEGLLVYRIPGHLTLCKSLDPRSNPLLAALSDKKHYSTQLAAHIAVELSRKKDHGDASEGDHLFEPFWNALDLDASTSHIPYFRTAAEMDLLNGTAESNPWAEYDRQTELVEGLAALFADDDDPRLRDLSLLNKTKFIMAHHFVSTHSFADANDTSRLPPLAINLNHETSGRATLRWYWDGESDTLQIWTARDVEPGEELTINYGLRSNAQLMSKYGFTIPPHLEPIYSFRAGVVSELVPHSLETTDLNFNLRLITLPQGAYSKHITDRVLERMGGAVQLLNRSRTAGLSPEEVLLDFLLLAKSRYEYDKVTASFVRSLAEKRKSDPTCSDWWTQDSGADGSSAEALGSRWKSDVLRMKMSEYLCLTSYFEALQLHLKRISDDECLLQARDLVPWISEMLEYAG